MRDIRPESSTQYDHMSETRAAAAPEFVISDYNWPMFMRCVADPKRERIDFFAASKVEKAAAIRFCGGCIVAPECLVQDLATPRLAEGIVAGLTIQSRELLRAASPTMLRGALEQMKQEREELIITNPDGYWES